MLKQLGVDVGCEQKDMCFGPLVLEELLKVLFKERFGRLEKKYCANQKQLEEVVATLQCDAMHCVKILRTLHVTWLLCLRACDLDNGAYTLTEDDNHARNWDGNFEHGINLDLVHCHYELLVREDLII